jgi:hypothetical protein
MQNEPSVAVRVGLPQFLHHFHFQIAFRNDFLEAKILLPHLPVLSHIRHLHLAKLPFPSINRLLRYPLLASGLLNRTVFGLSENADNLFFRESLLHRGPSQVEANLTYPWSKIRGVLQSGEIS